MAKDRKDQSHATAVLAGREVDARHPSGGGSRDKAATGTASRQGEPRPVVDHTLVQRTMIEVVDRWRRERGRPARPRPAFHVERIAGFVDALYESDNAHCQELGAEAMAECDNPQAVVELLFEPAARMIGQSWSEDENDFLKVTIAVSRMQSMFRKMTCDHPPAACADTRRRALLASAPGDQHAFGLSVVDDAFRRAGWDVDCCGCDEGLDLFRLTATTDYALIGISVSIERVLPEVRHLAARLRATSRNRSVLLMAGGSLVVLDPGLVVDAGFDLTATDALSAVSLAEAALFSTAGRDGLHMAAE